MSWLRGGLVVSSPNQTAFIASGSFKSCRYRHPSSLVPESGSIRMNDSRLFMFRSYLRCQATLPR